jgi:hypothetical protein
MDSRTAGVDTHSVYPSGNADGANRGIDRCGGVVHATGVHQHVCRHNY